MKTTLVEIQVKGTVMIAVDHEEGSSYFDILEEAGDEFNNTDEFDELVMIDLRVCG